LKKILTILILIILSVGLCSCKQNKDGEELVLKILEKNDLLQEKFPKNEINYISLNNNLIKNDYIQYGILVLSNDLDQKAIYSLIEDKYILNYTKFQIIDVFQKNCYIDYYQKDYSMVYIVVKFDDGLIAIYDIQGNIVLDKGDYKEYDIKLKNYYEIESFPNVNSRFLIEEITYSYASQTYLIKNKIDPKINTRISLNDGISIIYKEKYGTVDKYELTQIGLTGYYLYTDGDNLYIYDNNGHLINYIKAYNYTAQYGAGGKIIYQYLTPLDDDAKDYSYIYNGKKYKLTTIQLDVLTGEEKILDVNYCILMGFAIKDENGKYNYAFASIYKIENKNNIHKEVYAILDANGKILYETDNPYIFSMKKLKNNYYANYYTNTLYDNKLNPILNYSTIYAITSSEDILICSHNGKYGAVDLNGKVIIPFEFSKIGKDFVNNRIYVKDESGISYLISKDKEIIPLNYDRVNLISDGLLMLITNMDNNVKKVRVVDYLLNEYMNYEINGVENYFANVNVKIYFNEYSVYFHNDSNTHDFIVVDKSTDIIKMLP